MEIIYKFVACLVAVFAVVGNALVCYLILRKSRLHTIANRFILSLAVADLFVGLSSVPHSLLCEVGGRCPSWMVGFFYVFFLFASITNLCVMVADRYFTTIWPLRHCSVVTPGRAFRATVVAWIFPSVWWLFLVLTELLADDSTKANIKHAGALVDLVLFVLFPSVLLSLATSHMIFEARRLSRQSLDIIAQLNFNNHQESAATLILARRSASKTVKSVVIISSIVVCFELCYSTGVYRAFCATALFTCEPPYAVHVVSSLLYVVNSALNPVVYALLKEDIKAELRRFIHNCCPACF